MTPQESQAPLSKHGVQVLRYLANHPMPTTLVNSFKQVTLVSLFNRGLIAQVGQVIGLTEDGMLTLDEYRKSNIDKRIRRTGMAQGLRKFVKISVIQIKSKAAVA